MGSRSKRLVATSSRHVRRRATLCAIAAVLALLGGCVLQDVQLTDLEEVVIAEVMVQIRDDGVAANRPRVFALLHETPGTDGLSRRVSGATVTIQRAGVPIPLTERTRLRDCVVDAPDEYRLTCYRATLDDETSFLPGDSLTLAIDLPNGGKLIGLTVVPGDFHLIDAPPEGFCALPEGRTQLVRWTRSPGAWAYVSETSVRGFRSALQEQGFPVEQNSVHLLGVSVSQSDTTILFPSEFGLLERLTEDQSLLVALQQGIPRGSMASISIAAAERNYVNWQRGGSYNPSGQVRVPSLRGDGTGFFGATVVRSTSLWSPPRTDRQSPPDPECR